MTANHCRVFTRLKETRMLKLVAPALAVMAAIYFMKNRKKDADEADEGERIDAALAAGAYPAE